MEETWKLSSNPPCYLAPNTPHIRHLMIVELYTGKTKLCSYHDETPIKLVLKWVHQETKQEKDFDWESAPDVVKSAIMTAVCTRHNPWPGCHWSDSFVKAEGNTVYKNQNFPIGD